MTPEASETTQYPRCSPRASTLRALRMATGDGLPFNAVVTRETISSLSDMFNSSTWFPVRSSCAQDEPAGGPMDRLQARKLSNGANGSDQMPCQAGLWV